jgi:hypothetical protein
MYKGKERDLAVLSRLEDIGSDISKPHNLDFFLYFPSEELAKSAAGEIENGGYVVRVSPVEPPWWRRLFSKTAWSICTSKSMIPAREAILETSDWFHGIALRFDGEYDGWGTELVE